MNRILLYFCLFALGWNGFSQNLLETKKWQTFFTERPFLEKARIINDEPSGILTPRTPTTLPIHYCSFMRMAEPEKFNGLIVDSRA